MSNKRITKTLGGDRIGSGKKIKVQMHNYERSTHDLGYVWRNTQAPGTLVPFLCEVGLNGDTWDINLNTDVKTHPTIGPLFGSFKLQMDIYTCPIRLYQAQLHNNKLGIGNNMANVKLPMMRISGAAIDPDSDIPIDIQQINPSSLIAYLGIRGLGQAKTNPENPVTREKNAIPYLAYYDIYKNYYANKQEEIGAYINYSPVLAIIEKATVNGTEIPTTIEQNLVLEVTGTNLSLDNITVNLNISSAISGNPIGALTNVPIGNIITNIQINNTNTKIQGNINFSGDTLTSLEAWGQISTLKIELSRVIARGSDTTIKEPEVDTFPLSAIDEMREDILAAIKSTSPFTITNTTYAPYGENLKNATEGKISSKFVFPQQGLALKTYQSDLFNNWLNTEWIDGENGISAISAIDVSSGELKIDALILGRKVYDMLNRIAISGGTYNDWQETVYGEDAMRNAETPIYEGGMSREIVFQEVVSNSEATGIDGTEPLGTLAGKGVLQQGQKGGHVVIHIKEPSYIIGLVSITPRIDYSQGNKWDTRLKTMDDLHKPALDQIGFQDLITEQMAAFDVIGDGSNEELYAAGKQPAWINYMTNVNQCYGNFADSRNEMFMTLNRRYEYNKQTKRIKDLTTYIDPSKFNYAFAQTDIQAMNFWVQIGLNIEARRKMSARQIPNL